MTVANRSAEELWVCNLGTVAYLDGLAVQNEILARRQANELPDTLLLLEHPPVYTRGRRSKDSELPFDEDFYRARGIELHTTDRGGRITYHAPGQLVGYPIMAIGDIGVYLRTMEQAISAALAEEGIHAHGRPEDGPDYTGVWVGERKIASIGVHVSRGITTHGFAVNVHNDLEPFSWVIACGLPGVSMTSIARETSASCPPGSAGSGGPSLACFRKRMAHSFCAAHSRRQRLVSPARLGVEVPAPLTPRAANVGQAQAPLATVNAQPEPVPA